MKRDIAIVICSRGREDYLTRLLDDIASAFAPALEIGGLSVCTFVYAQNYPRGYMTMLAARFSQDIAAGRLILVEAAGPHDQIGYVVNRAIEALHARLDYRLAMVMDDDSLYRADPVVDANLLRAARDFLDHDDRAYSIKLGPGRQLEYWPFIDQGGPVMPFKEKMIWVSHAVMAEALAFEAFSTLSVGEDVVLAALAWRGGAGRCYGVFGLASFLHLGFEPDGEAVTPPITGGYGELVAYDEAAQQLSDETAGLGKYGAAYRSGIVPCMIMPEIFVGPEHPHYYINGIRAEAVKRFGAPHASFQRIERAGRQALT